MFRANVFSGESTQCKQITAIHLFIPLLRSSESSLLTILGLDGQRKAVQRCALDGDTAVRVVQRCADGRAEPT